MTTVLKQILDDPDGMLTIDEARSVLRCGRQTIYRLGADGFLELVKLGHFTRVTSKSVTKFIKGGGRPMTSNRKVWGGKRD